VGEREQVREAIAKRIRCYYFHNNEDIARSDETAAEILSLKWPDGSPMLVVGKTKTIVCPFCGDDDFDEPGLKYHLLRYCKVYGDIGGI